MEQLLSLLKTIPEYAAMVSSLQDGESVAVTGIGQINRSHMNAEKNVAGDGSLTKTVNSFVFNRTVYNLEAQAGE